VRDALEVVIGDPAASKPKLELIDHREQASANACLKRLTRIGADDLTITVRRGVAE
jgi:hypothetical protein